MSARIGSIPVAPRTTSRANRCQRRAPRTIEWPPGAVKRATGAPACAGPQGEVGRQLRRHPAVAAAVQDRDGPAAQVGHRLTRRRPGRERADGRDLRVAAGAQRRPAAHRVPDQHDRHARRRARRGAARSPSGRRCRRRPRRRSSRPPGSGAGACRCPRSAVRRADELLDGPHPHQRQGARRAAAPRSSPSRRGRTGRCRGRRPRRRGCRGAGPQGRVRHAAVLGSRRRRVVRIFAAGARSDARAQARGAAAQRGPGPVAEVAGPEQGPADAGSGRCAARARGPRRRSRPVPSGTRTVRISHMRSRREKKSHMAGICPARPRADQSSAAEPDDHLPGVAAAQEVEEGGHGVLQPLAHGLADDELAGGHQLASPSR